MLMFLPVLLICIQFKMKPLLNENINIFNLGELLTAPKTITSILIILGVHAHLSKILGILSTSTPARLLGNTPTDKPPRCRQMPGSPPS
ncbi:hypothetical protein VNO78_20447 [Psophocarpus tetragonolobus]|uniref:Uncharacterized protein n=1 Tax=Psophocarpus tetragonolobus TaxID=3891 RepID=A0AAN9S9Y9_PSOTE